MTNEEIIKKITEIQVREGWSYRKMGPRMGVSYSNLCNLVKGRIQLSENRKRLFMMAFELYEKGLLKK